MRPKDRRRRRRGGSRQEYYINESSAAFSHGATQAFVADDTMKNRGYKPLWFSISASSFGGPTLCQVRLYDKDGNSIYTSPGFMVNQTTVTRRYRFPRNLDPIPVSQSHTYAAVDCACVKSTDSNILYVVARLGCTLAHETLPDVCRVLERVCLSSQGSSS